MLYIGMRCALYKKLAYLALIFLWPAMGLASTLKPLAGEYVYEVQWNFLTIGKVVMGASEENGRYHFAVDSKTRGIVRLFERQKGLATAKGNITRMGEYVPTSYLSTSESDDGNRRSEVRYQNGKIIDFNATPKDDPSWRPLVPVNELQHATDPASAFLILRQKLLENFKAKIKETKVQTFDGRRLAEFTVISVNRATKKLGKEFIPVVNTVLKRRPIHGYTPKELKKYDEGDPQVHVYWSTDGYMLPVVIEVFTGFGKISLELQK